MNGGCRGYEGREEYEHSFHLQSMKARDHPEDLGINGRTTLRWGLGKRVWRLDRIY
jgi:hypothetical protein